MEDAMITKEELDQIATLADSMPEQYRQKCFEILLEHTLKEKQTPVQASKVDAGAIGKDNPGQERVVKPNYSLDVRAFFSQFGLDDRIIEKFFVIEGAEIRYIYKLKTETSKPKQHALMMCLENALVKGAFQITEENLRTRCKETNCYDTSNFTKTFTRNTNLFKNEIEEGLYSLMPDGKSELADLLESLLE